jgi:hypothetical protein
MSLKPPSSRQLVYVAGAGHSGSTLLGMILSQHSRMIGLGEVHQVLRESRFSGIAFTREKQARCSCGGMIDECVFWGEVARKIESASAASYAERYRILLDVFHKQFGEEAIPVDLSKGLEPLLALSKADLPIRISVIHLLKDVRAYAVSNLDRYRKLRSRGISATRGTRGFLETFVRRFMPFFFITWYRQNRRIKEGLARNGIESFQLGYEELCFAPDRSIGMLCEFLGTPSEATMLSPLEASNSHILRGNRMRHREDRRVISYDTRWLYRNEWTISSALFRRIMKFNAEEVYSHSLRASDPTRSASNPS